MRVVARVAVVVGALASSACGAKGLARAGATASAKADDAPKEKSADAGRDDGAPKPTASSGVDVGAVVAAGATGEDLAALPVNLDGIANDAPIIAAKPPVGASQVSWIDAGSDSIPSYGFTKQEAKGLMFLEAPDKSGGVVFTTFGDRAEGGRKVRSILDQLKLKDAKWKRPRAVLLPTDKIPALVGGGHGTDPDGKGVRVVYAFIQGEPNLLAIAGVNDTAAQSVVDAVFATIGGIKRKR